MTSEKKALMKHHHYHCEQNPEAFEKLKVDNFSRWAHEDVQKEAELLKQN